MSAMLYYFVKMFYKVVETSSSIFSLVSYEVPFLYFSVDHFITTLSQSNVFVDSLCGFPVL